MVKSIRLQNFKIGESRSFDFEDRISVIGGEVGSARSIALDAFRVLMSVARKADTAAVPDYWIASDSSTRLSASFATYEYPDLTYAVAMRRIDGKTVILDEKVSSGNNIMLDRKGDYYHAGAKTLDKRPIDRTKSAIGDALKYLPENEPVHDVTKEFQELWLVMPDALRMGSIINANFSSDLDAAFTRLATYIAFRTGKDAAIRGSMLSCLMQVKSAAIAGLSVKNGKNGELCLMVRHKNDLNHEGIPFGALDNSEKMLFLAAFVCAVNENAAPISVMWDLPANWLGAQGGDAVVKMLRRSFARRGQLVMST